MILPDLFKPDSKGRSRLWRVWADGADIVVEHGLADGQLTDSVKTAKPKNVGKSNETTAHQQAELEAAALHRQQIEREDYHQDIKKAGMQFRPMLAQDYLKVPHLLDWDRAIAQVKLDGLRLNYGQRGPESSEHEFMSRKGINYALPHLTEGVTELYQFINSYLEDMDHWCQMLDGEVYCHGWTCQSILSAARKLQDTTEQLDYYLFDLAIEDMVFSDRHDLLEYALSQVAPHFPQLKLVNNLECESEAEALVHQGQFMQLGFEGVMLRHRDSEYEVATRSSDLFKFKSFKDCECLITKVWADNNGNAMLTCVFPETDMQLDCTPKRTHKERKAMLDDETLIGSFIKVKYQALSEDGVPLFPVGLEIRPMSEVGEPLV